MILDIYAEIVDEDRRNNAIIVEDEIFSKLKINSAEPELETSGFT